MEKQSCASWRSRPISKGGVTERLFLSGLNDWRVRSASTSFSCIRLRMRSVSIRSSAFHRLNSKLALSKVCNCAKYSRVPPQKLRTLQREEGTFENRNHL